MNRKTAIVPAKISPNLVCGISENSKTIHAARRCLDPFRPKGELSILGERLGMNNFLYAVAINKAVST